MSRFTWLLTELSTRLWIRASIYAVLAVITALISIYVRHYIPEDIPQKIGADAVDGILNILASSMLAVTIFSVSTMVAAYGAATNNATPRATRLLVEDKISHNALSTFIGAFIFSIVGIVALTTGAYGNTGRLVLFVVTILILCGIVVTLLRWIEYLSRLGRVNETIQRVEEAASAALRERLANPYLGGTPMLPGDKAPADTVPLTTDDIGYVQHIDMGLLSDVAGKRDLQVYIAAMPGKLVHPTQPLAFIGGACSDDDRARAVKAFIVGPERSFRQDPRYGMVVLSEIASRALSPAVNDPGTALHVVTVGLRVTMAWRRRHELASQEAPPHPRIHVPGLAVADLLEDFLGPIERDGAAHVEVGLVMQRALAAFAQSGDADLREAALRHASSALARAQGVLNETEMVALRAVAPAGR
ncbi:DUF2254 domain-containing protein [Cupriavidus respiraculi]|uniref:DUF2254 domain-containing protein n=1 Tax=Cupriavidus respiraculi TaxID=195930 RepID=A0ABM8WKN9_9BURK|nr:DUF2254 domain-containing protein [Cupriavidus respiraculi]CAG9167958.1 hypothetical protein LMG21510_00911 [Cupriavidus respiraculi]